MNIMKVANVEEAIALASRLQQEGKYDWFRGQVHDWPPASSFERKLSMDENLIQQHESQLSRFLEWLKGTPSLEYLAEAKNVDSVFAVLQHYGFPTCYIDFTTDPSVAGFFASDCLKPPEDNGNCVIYCLNTSELIEFYKTIANTGHLPHLHAEPVTVDVSNLWRLQAQHGKFLYVNHNWYNWYDMDQIVFPWTGYPAYPTREQIYPEDKSNLEQLLDQYFHTEQSRKGYLALLDISRTLTENGAKLESYYVESYPNKYDETEFSETLTRLPSWRHESIKPWLQPPLENFYSTVGQHVDIKLRSEVQRATPSARHQIEEAIKGALRRQIDLRRNAIKWIFSGLPEGVDKELFSNSVRAAWNGMRTLPYSDEDIAIAIGTLVDLCAIPDCRSIDGGTVFRAFCQWIPDSYEVEFCTQDGASSRGYCSETRLRTIVDKTWKKKLKNTDKSDSLTKALQLTYDPSLLFNFNDFAKLFAREIIPSQLARGRNLVLFNPACLSQFGLP